jgi:hypothetical protein
MKKPAAITEMRAAMKADLFCPSCNDTRVNPPNVIRLRPANAQRMRVGSDIE